MNLSQYLEFNSKTVSATIVFFIALINVTPLCGFLFDCGCTWLAAGFEENCNIHNVNALHKCPWCSSSIAGFLSVGLSVFAGLWLAISLKVFDENNIRLDFNPVVIRSSSGLTIFLVVAFFTGWLSAVIQDYPNFIISFLE